MCFTNSFDVSESMSLFSKCFRSDFGDFVDPLFSIGLHDETKLTPVELKEQLLELLDVFLGT
jgi:hypothetical protein